MLKEKTYLGFIMMFPDEEEPILHVYDVSERGVKRYGGYRVKGPTGDEIDLCEATIVTVQFEDGTLPILVDEFDDRIRAGETWDKQEYNIFTKIKCIGSTIMERGVELHDILKRDPANFHRAMFNDCLGCMEARSEFNKKREEMTKNARKTFDERLAFLEQSIPNKDMFEMCKETIIDLLDEREKVADKALVDAVLKENEALAKKKVPVAVRAVQIARVMAKKYDDQRWPQVQKQAKAARSKKKQTS